MNLKHSKKFIVTLISIIALSVLSLSLLISTIVLGVNFDKTKKRYEVTRPVYDFYVTLGTMPTLYATLNAYTQKNPNTYMWFYRGNTISYEYSADYINYFDSQSKTNDNSTINYWEIKQKVKDIKIKDPDAKFHLHCDDLRVRFILDLFVGNGVAFEDLQVTLLSDGTGTYSNYAVISDQDYTGIQNNWNIYLREYKKHANDFDYTHEHFKENFNGQAMELQLYAFYLSTFDNVEYWIQSPEYLKNAKSEKVNKARESMNIVKKDPKAMYSAFDARTKAFYQRAVLANALVNSDILSSLEQAQAYFDSQLSNRDKDVVLILGTSYNGLEYNKPYIDQVIEFYTPKADLTQGTVSFKGQTYQGYTGGDKFTINGKELTLNECAVYLFFKGHPAHPANEELMQYFSDNNIVVLPHRTPVETLFWMYDVKVGGYESTCFLSTTAGQTEFFFGEPTNDALVSMEKDGFFNGTKIFNIDSND